MSDNQDFNDEHLSDEQNHQMNGNNGNNMKYEQQNYDDDVS